MRGSVLLIVAVAALGLAACTDRTAGTATAGDEPTSEPPAEETTEPDTGDSPLADVQPCSLLSAQAASTLGLTGGEDGTTGEARDCEYRYEGATIDDSFTVGVAIFDELGLDDVDGKNIQQLPNIGAHEAVAYFPPAGGCAVSMKTGESSRVDTLAVGGAEQKACELAWQLATAVESELP